jgi:membrane protein implicated in regulation of membrane protease activity
MNPDLTLMDWFLALAPLVVLGGLLWFLIQRALKFWERYSDMLNRQNTALERIAVALEKRHE